MMLGLDDFKGDWQIRREITDRLTGQTGKLEGTATFTDHGGDGLIYTEAGRLHLGGGPVLEATRSYQWRFTGDLVDVCFADGAAFHSFVPHGYVSGTDHPCGDDAYAVRYDFIPWPRWRSVWVVTGPRKDYTSVTEFFR